MTFDYVTRMPYLPFCWVSSLCFGYRISFLVGSVVFFTDGCSAVSCDFGVLLTGDELKVLLLCHLVKVPLRG